MASLEGGEALLRQALEVQQQQRDRLEAAEQVRGVALHHPWPTPLPLSRACSTWEPMQVCLAPITHPTSVHPGYYCPYPAGEQLPMLSSLPPFLLPY